MIQKYSEALELLGNHELFKIEINNAVLKKHADAFCTGVFTATIELN